MAGDLHTHTNFSDGSLDIERLPSLAARAGLTHLAVSDHDTALSVEYAMKNPQVSGVSLIPAVELTCEDKQRNRCVHFLCYCPALTPQLRAFFALMAQRRNDALAKSMAQLEVMCPQFVREDALALAARSGVVYKTYVSRVLFEYGYTDGIYKDLYRELFGKPGGKFLHEPAYESVETVLTLMRQAGGVAVLAHPSVYKSMELCAELAAAGSLDGVEIEHPRNTAADKEQLYALARRYDLLVTGGTDFHGMHMAHPTPLGAITTSEENIGRVMAIARVRRAQIVG